MIAVIGKTLLVFLAIYGGSEREAGLGRALSCRAGLPGTAPNCGTQQADRERGR
jgi:hypothetical protein